MATVAEKSSDLAVPEWAPSQAVDEKIDRYLAGRLKAVGADYRSVAITTFLLASAIGLLLWLGAGVIADHWLVPGGLGRTLRIAWLAVAAAALLAAATKWVVPLVRYRVNLVYAARSIERANPDLRNDVVNTVLVRAHPERISPVVVTSLEHRTAKRLSKLPADVVTDRGPALRLAMALAILVALACLYAVFSPKSLGTSLARLVAPWSRVAAPTRVQIGEPELGWRLPASERAGGEAFHPIPLEDGRATIIRNRQLVIRSRIRGMASGEEPAVEAVGVAEDGTIDRASGWRSRMEPSASGGEGGFEATLPGGGLGLSHDLVVSLKAGDATSDPMRVVVVDAPSLLVKQLKLVPPAYTHREPEILEWQGDLSGLEGTKVTLLAESKDPLETAAIDFGCDGQMLVKLRIDARDLARASGSFDLRLSADRSGPWERNYQLVFRPQGGPDGDGRERGIEHRINVVADTMPEVRVVEPGKPVVKVPPEKPVAVVVEAVDPDFALKSVAIELELEHNGERMPRPAQAILEREFAGTFRGQAVFKPASVGGQAGDRLHYRAVAVDTKTPSPNAARTEWFTLELDAGAPPRPVPPSGREGNDQQGSGDGQGDASKGSEGGKGGGNGQSNSGQSNSGQSNSGQGGGKQNGGEETQGSSEQPQQGKGERGSGPPEKGSEGERAQGAGGSADGSSQESHQASGSDGSDSSGTKASGSESNEKGTAGSQGGSKGSSGDGADDRGDRQSGEGQRAAGQKNGERRRGGGEQANGSQPDGQKQTAENADGAGEPTEGNAQGSGGAGQGDRRQGDQRQGKQQPSQRGAGERSEGERSGADKPVASDGTNDGEAIERILQNKSLEEKSQDGVTQEKGSENEKNGDGEKNQAQNSAEQRPGDASGESGDCRPEEGKPCGNKECSKCQGGGREGGSSGGGSGQGGGDQKGNGQKGNGQKDGGQQGSGEQASGKEGRGQQPSGAGQDGGSSGGSSSGDDDRTKDGSKKPGSGESGAGQPADDGGETASQPGGDNQTSSGSTSKGADSKNNGGDPKNGGKKGGDPSAGGDAGRKPGEGGREGDSAQRAPSQNRKSGDGKSGGGKPGDSDVGRPGEDLANDDPASDRKPSEQAGAGGRAGRGFGGQDAGEEGNRGEGVAASKEADWGEENLAHARNAVDLAVEHLKRSMDEGRSDVLDSLGWTREQAQAFLDRWTRMAESAKEGGPRKQQDFDRAVRSLGLTPPGVRRSRETVEDARGGQAEGRRSQPPPDYREQFRAFTQGLRSDGG